MKTKTFFLILFFIIKCSAVDSQTSPKVNFSGANASSYSKLKSYLFQNHVLLRSGELKYPEFKGTYIHNIDESELTKLYTFVRNGGRAWVYINAYDGRYNDRLQELFEISIANEQITKSKSAASISGDHLCKLWSGLKIAANPNKSSYIDSYLVLLNEMAWKKTYIVSEESGKSRILSAQTKIGNGEILFMCGYDCFITTDQTIELMDNEKAIIDLMFQWLAHKTEYY